MTSHPLLWKNSSQPASARSDAASRLLDIPGDRWAIRACVGSFVRCNRRVSVVTKVPFGCVIHFLGNCVGDRWAGASECRRDMLAPVSRRAVVLRSGGLAQPGVVVELTKWCRDVFSFKFELTLPAGLPRQVLGFQPMFSWLPPIVFARVAPSL